MRLKKLLSDLFCRYPVLSMVLAATYRLTQPRYTLGVSGILLDDQGRVLLVKHVFHVEPQWGVPGGWVGRRESPPEALRREFYEELRLVIRVTDLLLVGHNTLWKNHLDMMYLVAAEALPAELDLCYELTDYNWHPLDDLPALKSFHRQGLEALRARLSATNGSQKQQSTN